MNFRKIEKNLKHSLKGVLSFDKKTMFKYLMLGVIGLTSVNALAIEHYNGNNLASVDRTTLKTGFTSVTTIAPDAKSTGYLSIISNSAAGDGNIRNATTGNSAVVEKRFITAEAGTLGTVKTFTSNYSLTDADYDTIAPIINNLPVANFNGDARNTNTTISYDDVKRSNEIKYEYIIDTTNRKIYPVYLQDGSRAGYRVIKNDDIDVKTKDEITKADYALTNGFVTDKELALHGLRGEIKESKNTDITKPEFYTDKANNLVSGDAVYKYALKDVEIVGENGITVKKETNTTNGKIVKLTITGNGAGGANNGNGGSRTTVLGNGRIVVNTNDTTATVGLNKDTEDLLNGIGTGEVADGNDKTVTGGKVFNAIKDKANKNLDNIDNAGKKVITDLIDVRGANGIEVVSAIDNATGKETFTVKNAGLTSTTKFEAGEGIKIDSKISADGTETKVVSSLLDGVIAPTGTPKADDRAVTGSTIYNYLHPRLDKIEQGVEEAKAGVSLIAAMANIPDNFKEGSNNLAGVGVGYFAGHTSVALGYQRKLLDESMVLKATGSINTKGQFSVGAGAAVSW